VVSNRGAPCPEHAHAGGEIKRPDDVLKKLDVVPAKAESTFSGVVLVGWRWIPAFAG
jgi:hypothetical protein